MRADRPAIPRSASHWLPPGRALGACLPRFSTGTGYRYSTNANDACYDVKMNKQLQFVADFTEATALELLNDSVYVGGGSLVYVRHCAPSVVRSSATCYGCRYRYRLRSALISATPGYQSYCALPASHKAPTGCVLACCRCCRLPSGLGRALLHTCRSRNYWRADAAKLCSFWPAVRYGSHSWRHPIANSTDSAWLKNADHNRSLRDSRRLSISA